MQSLNNISRVVCVRKFEDTLIYNARGYNTYFKVGKSYKIDHSRGPKSDLLHVIGIDTVGNDKGCDFYLDESKIISEMDWPYANKYFVSEIEYKLNLLLKLND